jgi:protein-disulfide isomerase/uncharacterized membrane protein
MKFNKKNLFIQIAALIGLFLSVELCFIYYNANYNAYALSSFCSINNFIDCDGSARTIYSQFLGIPLSYWGVFLYLTILFLTFVDKLKNIKFLKFLEVFKKPDSYITFLGTIAFICSMILAAISLSVIKKLCILCFATYLIDLLIAMIASDCKFKTLISGFKQTFFDFADGAKKYKKTCAVLILLTAGFLAYSGMTLNFVPNIKTYNSINKYRKMKHNPYRISGNMLGNPVGTVVIDLYSDYVCPMCYINNIMLHKAAKQYKNIKIIHHNYPFDKECNKYLTYNMHPKACFMSRIAIAAKNQGNYWGMSSLLYENKPKNIEEAVKLADKLKFDKEKFIADIDSQETINSLLADIEDGQKANVDGTPTMIINGDKTVGVKPYFKLQEILEKHGAKR